MPEVLPTLQSIVQRFEDPTLKAALKGYTRNFHLMFSDSGESYTLRILDGQSASLESGLIPPANATLATTSTVFSGIVEGKINPISAFNSGKVKIKGSADDMLRLARLLV